MSPSWRERVCIFVAEGEVRLRVHSRGLKPQAGPLVRAATLREALQGVQLARADAEVTLSQRLVRHAVVSDADALRNDGERQAAAAHALAQTYGEMARDWDVAADRALRFPRMVAAGVDARLRQEIEGTLQAAGVASVSIQPALARALAAAGRVPASGWVAVLEPARVVLAAFAGGTLAAVHSQRLRSSPAADLAVLLQQSRLLDGLPAGADELVVCAEEGIALEAPAGLRVREVPLDFSAPQGQPRRADPIQLEFGRRLPLVRSGDLAWLALGGAVFAVAAWHYTQLATEGAALRTTVAEAERFTQRQGGRPLDPNRPDAKALAADVLRANAVAARLQVPWDALFTDIELAAGEGVTLLGLEPEGGMRRLRITGEARRFEDLTQYLRRLEGTPALHNVFLTGHELRDRGLTFTLTADWVRSDEPPRP